MQNLRIQLQSSHMQIPSTKENILLSKSKIYIQKQKNSHVNSMHTLLPTCKTDTQTKMSTCKTSTQRQKCPDAKFAARMLKGKNAWSYSRQRRTIYTQWGECKLATWTPTHQKCIPAGKTLEIACRKPHAHKENLCRVTVNLLIHMRNLY